MGESCAASVSYWPLGWGFRLARHKSFFVCWCKCGRHTALTCEIICVRHLTRFCLLDWAVHYVDFHQSLKVLYRLNLGVVRWAHLHWCMSLKDGGELKWLPHVGRSGGLEWCLLMPMSALDVIKGRVMQLFVNSIMRQFQPRLPFASCVSDHKLTLFV